MEGIKELTIDGERVFVKKSKIFGWGFVKPYKIDGKTNWKNVLIGGSWVRFGLLALGIIIAAGLAFEYSNAIRIANECLQKAIPVITLP